MSYDELVKRYGDDPRIKVVKPGDNEPTTIIIGGGRPVERTPETENADSVEPPGETES